MVDEKLVKLAIDAHNGNLSGEYSLAESQEVLRQAMIEANNGKTTMSWKDIRDGKCNGLFSIIEVLVNRISEEGLQGDEMFNQMVEDRNLALGDSNIFHVKKPCLFTVASISEGNQSVRRQRIESGQDITLKTSVHAIKIYEELNRVLSGRVDFNEFVDMVSKSFTNDELNTAYAAFTNMFNGLDSTYLQTGSYDEGKLLDLIDHVEAATGEKASIYGTRKALRKITTATMSDSAKEDVYAMGYIGHLAGTPLIRMRQRHEIGGSKFILNDNIIYVLAGSSKPIKRVTEGDVTMMLGTPMDNADMSQEFLMIKRTGIGVVMDREYGAYKLS